MIWNGSYDKLQPEAIFTHSLVIPMALKRLRKFTTLRPSLQHLTDRYRRRSRMAGLPHNPIDTDMPRVSDAP
jgi:hypothetical protein